MPIFSNSGRVAVTALLLVMFHAGLVFAQSAETVETPGGEATIVNDIAPPAVDEPAVDTATPSAPEPSQPVATTPEGEQVPQDEEHEEMDIPYSREGADTCLKCHDEDSEVPVLALFKTKHAVQADHRTPFAQLQCESCHGPGGEHGKRVRRGETRPPIRNFGKLAATPVDEQNRVCLDCHEDYARSGWQGSVHQRQDVTCVSCHRIHIEEDPVLITSRQPEVCMDCHKRQRAEFHRASTHPVRYGQMACSDCHEPHDSTADALLKRPTLNQTCYTCHAEKRGPFLWEHAPAAEDCSLCHRPHGSNHPNLLTRRAPLLCQQCHSRMGHPSVQYTGRGLADQTPSPRVLAGSCTNCHTQVHGSNHPSGADFSR